MIKLERYPRSAKDLFIILIGILRTQGICGLESQSVSLGLEELRLAIIVRLDVFGL